MKEFGPIGLRFVKLLLKSKVRGGVVRFQDVYTFALAEMSKTLGEPPPPDATLVGEVEGLRKKIQEAEAVLEAPSDTEFAMDNPVQAMRLFSFSLKTGVDRKITVAARTLRFLDEFAKDDTISDAQKERIIRLAVESYLLGLLAPVAQLDLFSEKLDDLLLETRCATREEMMRELREERARKHSMDEVLLKLEQLQKNDIQSSALKPKLTLNQKVFIINASFRGLDGINVKSSFTSRTIQNWDKGKCPHEGYSSLFTALELKAWANKTVAEIRMKQAVQNSIHGMSDDEMSRKKRS